MKKIYLTGRGIWGYSGKTGGRLLAAGGEERA